MAANLDTDNVTVEAEIKTWANLNILESSSLFDKSLKGKEGLDVSDAHKVKGEAQDLWDLTDADLVNHEEAPGALFEIKSNDEVNVVVETPFDGDWLNSPSAFLVFEHWSPYNHLGTLHNNHPTEVDNNGMIQFTHGAGGPSQYKIGGAVYIEDIAEDTPGKYSTSITITVEKL